MKTVIYIVYYFGWWKRALNHMFKNIFYKNTMKKILSSILFTLLFIFWIVWVWIVWATNTQLETSVSKTQISVSDSLRFTIKLQWEDINWELSPTIAWIENFEIFSRQNSMSFQSINGETRGNLELILQLRPKKEGVYTLWPVELLLWNEILKDDTIYEIQVWDTSTSVQNWQTKLWYSFWEKNNTIKLPELRGLQEEKNSQYIIWWMFWIFFLIFFIFLIYLLKYIQAQGTQKSLKAEKTQEINVWEMSLKETYFWELSEDLDSQTFSEKYLLGVRRYLRDQGLKNAEHMTLSELKSEYIYQNSPLKDDFESCYYRLYRENLELSWEQKKSIIEHLISL